MCCTFVQGGEEREEEGRARGNLQVAALALLEALDDEEGRVEEAVDAVGWRAAGERGQPRKRGRRERRRGRGRTEAGLLATAEARARLALDAAAVVRASVECAEGWRGRGRGREEERRDAQVPAAVGKGVDLGLEGGLCLLLSEEGLELALCGGGDAE